MAPGRHRRRYRAGAVGRCATVAVGAAAIAAGFSSVAAAPAPPDDPTLIARSARAAFAVPAEDHAVDDAGDDAGVDASALAERRASRDLIRPPVTPPLLPAAPPTDTLPPPTAPGAAPQTDPTPRFTTSTARTGAAVEGGLTTNAMKVLNAVRAAYPQLTSFGGARSQRGSDHSTGQAIDIMIPSQALGDAIAAFVQGHAAELGVDYVIWRQRIWSPGRGGWRGMSDRGDATANHFDHVHVSVR